MKSGRLSRSTFSNRQWSAAGLLSTFTVEDVWQLPVRGAADDLPHLADALALGERPENAARDRTAGDSRIYDALFAIRWCIGRVFHWDDPATRRPSLRDALPPDVLDVERGPDFRLVPLRSVLLTQNEWVVEIVNATAHGVMHVGWRRIDDVDDTEVGKDFTAEMTVLTRPNGLLGRAYMALIKPFRIWLVYPSLLRRFGADWENWHRRGTTSGP